MAKDPHAQADRIYHDLLDLLEELTSVFSDAAADDEAEDDDGLNVDDVIEAVVEEAAERGLDEESAKRIFTAISVITKKAAQG